MKNYQFRLSLFFVIFIYSCTINPENKKEDSSNQSIQGAWELLSYQPQADTLFVKMEGVIVKKVFSVNEWMSSAYKTESNQVVHVAGGTFKLEGELLSEKIAYSLKHPDEVGKINRFKIQIMGDTLYQSGILFPGTPDEYKIEEYWVRNN